jgi:hypothetical protein
MTVNIAALDAALAAIDADPISWHQGSWAVKTECGTVFCLAGHVATQAGGRPDWFRSFADAGERVWEADRVVTPDGRITMIRAYAEEVLRVDDDWAHALFHGRNTREDLQRLRDQLAGDPDLAER